MTKGWDGHSQDSFVTVYRESLVGFGEISCRVERGPRGLHLRVASSWDSPLANSRQENRDLSYSYEGLCSVRNPKEFWRGPQPLDEDVWPASWFQPREAPSTGPRHTKPRCLTYGAVRLNVYCCKPLSLGVIYYTRTSSLQPYLRIRPLHSQAAHTNSPGVLTVLCSLTSPGGL